MATLTIAVLHLTDEAAGTKGQYTTASGATTLSAGGVGVTANRLRACEIPIVQVIRVQRRCSPSCAGAVYDLCLWAVRNYVAVDAVNLRKSFDGFMAHVRPVLAHDLLSGHVFAFINRRRNHVKLLMWTRGGFTTVHNASKLAHSQSSSGCAVPRHMLNSVRTS
jgi:hypothetical protein